MNKYFKNFIIIFLCCSLFYSCKQSNSPVRPTEQETKINGMIIRYRMVDSLLQDSLYEQNRKGEILLQQVFKNGKLTKNYSSGYTENLMDFFFQIMKVEISNTSKPLEAKFRILNVPEELIRVVAHGSKVKLSVNDLNFILSKPDEKPVQVDIGIIGSPIQERWRTIMIN